MRKNLKNKKLLVVNVSGGRTSALLAKFIQVLPKYENYEKVYIFANTSKERPETIEFLKEVDSAFGLNLVKLEAVFTHTKGIGSKYRIVKWDELKMNGEIFEEMIKKSGLPNFKASSCTNLMKIVPINKYIKSLGYRYVFSALGIRADEQQRATINQRDKGIIFPFIDDMLVDEDFVRTYWSKQPFDLKLKNYEGNCDLCFKKSLRNRLTILQQNPAVANWWLNQEQKFTDSSPDRFDLRQQHKISDLLEMAKTFDNVSLDKYRKKNGVSKLKALPLDISYDCLCSNS
ncbi:MAG: phosphoadenosine phosphosulfate reductase family protein [bacterium]|nr:phosphoadenosine phosphosulfate reductase family protein [bacterium]